MPLPVWAASSTSKTPIMPGVMLRFSPRIAADTTRRTRTATTATTGMPTTAATAPMMRISSLNRLGNRRTVY